MLFFFFLMSYGQNTIERNVVAASGETISNGNIQLDFTVGETVVEDLSNTTLTLNQGFHQAYVALGIKINPVVFLQGALIQTNTGEENLMRDDLREIYIPLISPYQDGLTCDVSVLLDGGASGTGLKEDNIVDWIYVELRDKNDNTNVIIGKSAFLQRDGDVVDLDGVSVVNILADVDDYYVAIKHRNHLGIISANVISLSNTAIRLDFSDSNNQITWGDNAQSTYGNSNAIASMWAGNANSDSRVRYQGSSNDSNSVKSSILLDQDVTPKSNLHFYFAYNNSDIDMDGKIRYQGSGNDVNIIKSIVYSHPDNPNPKSNLFFITEQLPEN